MGFHVKSYTNAQIQMDSLQHNIVPKDMPHFYMTMWKAHLKIQRNWIASWEEERKKHHITICGDQ